MKNNVPDQISIALYEAGIKKGDSIFVHSRMLEIAMALRRFTDVPSDETMAIATKTFHQALTNCIGTHGTVSVPSFYYDYARYGKIFDACDSPPDDSLGAYPQYFFHYVMTHRSLCPPVSIMCRGPHSENICECSLIPFGYGHLSPWQKLVELDGVMLFFGVTPQMMTFGHHVEALAGVPHTYNKLYTVPIIGLDGTKHNSCISCVRYIEKEFSVVIDFETMRDEMISTGIARKGVWAGGEFYIVRFREALEFLAKKLSSNPYYLLASTPTFNSGIPPMDGPVGDLPHIKSVQIR